MMIHDDDVKEKNINDGNTISAMRWFLFFTHCIWYNKNHLNDLLLILILIKIVITYINFIRKSCLLFCLVIYTFATFYYTDAEHEKLMRSLEKSWHEFTNNEYIQSKLVKPCSLFVVDFMYYLRYIFMHKTIYKKYQKT